MEIAQNEPIFVNTVLGYISQNSNKSHKHGAELELQYGTSCINRQRVLILASNKVK